MNAPDIPADALRENQPIGNLLQPVCWVLGHDNKLPEEWHQLIECRRCKRNTTRAYWWQLIPSRIARVLVSVANWLIREDKNKIYFSGYARINNIEYIGRAHLQSLVNQGDDELLSDYLSGKNWIRLSDLKHEDGTPYTGKEQADLINKSLTLEATKQEQEKLNEYFGDYPLTASNSITLYFKSKLQYTLMTVVLACKFDSGVLILGDSLVPYTLDGVTITGYDLKRKVCKLNDSVVVSFAGNGILSDAIDLYISNLRLQIGSSQDFEYIAQKIIETKASIEGNGKQYNVDFLLAGYGKYKSDAIESMLLKYINNVGLIKTEQILDGLGNWNVINDAVYSLRQAGKFKSLNTLSATQNDLERVFNLCRRSEVTSLQSGKSGVNVGHIASPICGYIIRDNGITEIKSSISLPPLIREGGRATYDALE